MGNINGVVKKICFQKVETIKASADSKTVIVQKIWELKIYKEPSVPIRARRKMQWPAVGGPWPVKASNQPFRSLKKNSVLFLKWTGSRAREGNSWTHALIMLYFRWYPVVSHFNNPPQLDILVPSAHQCLVIGPGWKSCWGLTTSTLMESTMRDTHPIFIVSHPFLVFSPSLSQMAPPGCWGCHGQGSEQGMAGREAT